MNRQIPRTRNTPISIKAKGAQNRLSVTDILEEDVLAFVSFFATRPYLSPNLFRLLRL